jgi:drug/metabolite transporter (DMT)-like permease
MSTKWKAMLFVLLGAASYGVLSTIVKLSYQAGFLPGEITGSQVLFGAATLWMLCLATGSWRPARPIEMLKLLAGGSFTGLTGVFYYYSLQLLDASFAVLLLFQFTWMGMLLDWLRGKKPSGYKGAAVLFILVGTLMASGLLQGGADHVSWLGIGLGLLSAASYTLFIDVSGKLATGLPAMQRSALMITGAAVVVSMIYPPDFLWSGALHEGLWLWGLLLSLFGMILPTYLFAKGAPQLDTGLSAILGSIELPVVIVCSSLLLNEASGLPQWLGIVLILAGMAVAEYRPLNSKRTMEY